MKPNMAHWMWENPGSQLGNENKAMKPVQKLFQIVYTSQIYVGNTREVILQCSHQAGIYTLRRAPGFTRSM